MSTIDDKADIEWRKYQTEYLYAEGRDDNMSDADMQLAERTFKHGFLRGEWHGQKTAQVQRRGY